ncbi:radial spoke head 1 homolog [Paramacrobiotus metropolitanus]|uniref:radial spoke head 1 homolog n=1 Tax=Paramacrobiotus metropolitanus TaxID=2943436 RepID=UPI00244614B2|nr:radial spoke head 1 homolog [Paramacrobiotus metropolitanus]
MDDDPENEEGEESAFTGEYHGERNAYNQRHGQGTTILPNGDKYKGQYAHNLRDGKGTYVFKSGSRYEGSWRCGVKHGTGKFIYSDGSTYEGHWINDKRYGYGKYTYQSGDTFSGQWKDGERSGFGVYYYKESGARYVGFWLNGRRHGKGELLFGSYKFHGNFQNDTVVGPGKFVFLGGYEQQGHFIPYQSAETKTPPPVFGKRFLEDEPDWPDALPDLTTTWIAEMLIVSANPAKAVKPEELMAKLEGTADAVKLENDPIVPAIAHAEEDFETMLQNAQSGESIFPA